METESGSAVIRPLAAPLSKPLLWAVCHEGRGESRSIGPLLRVHRRGCGLGRVSVTVPAPPPPPITRPSSPLAVVSRQGNVSDGDGRERPHGHGFVDGPDQRLQRLYRVRAAVCGVSCWVASITGVPRMSVPASPCLSPHRAVSPRMPSHPASPYRVAWRRGSFDALPRDGPPF